MERDILTFLGNDFNKGDLLVFNNKVIGNAIGFHYDDEFKLWCVSLYNEYISCPMVNIRYANELEKITYLRFTKDFNTVSVRYTSFFK